MYRLQNVGRHPLTLDLRGGEAIRLKPGEISRPLREEWLYGNPYLPLWKQQGLVREMTVESQEGHAPPEEMKVAPAEEEEMPPEESPENEEDEFENET